MRYVRFIRVAPVVALSAMFTWGCAHNANAPPAASVASSSSSVSSSALEGVSTTSLTSAEVQTGQPGAGDSSRVDEVRADAAEGTITEPTARLAAPDRPREVPSLNAWTKRYPGAATELGDWIAANPQTAHALGAWQKRHPEQMEALVDWSITYPTQSLGAFLMDRAGWDELSAIAGGDDDARGFMSWVRRAPSAARELAVYGNGLSFLNGRVQTAGSSARIDTSPGATGGTLAPQ